MLLGVASRAFQLLLFGAIICQPSSIDAQQTFLWQGQVTTDRLKIFSQVSSPNELVMNLKKGNVVNVVLEISVLGDKWCRVELPDQPDPAGYALCSGLTKLRSAATQNTHADTVTLTRREKVTIATTPIETSPERNQPKSAVLTNKDILDMSHAGFPADILAAKIKATTCAFDTTPGDLQQLKAAGIPDSVILAMIEAPAGAASLSLAGAIPGSSRSASAAEKGSMVGDVLLDEIGVYYRQNGIMKPIEPEIVNWQTGGVLKRQLTLGIDKGHVNGTVAKPHSGLGISRNASESFGVIDFYVRCPDGNSASEYQLLHLWEKGDREFRAVTGGVLHESGGAKKNLVAFTFEKIGPRTYRIQIPNLAAGEYGLLAPGAIASANVASQGKLYSFKILE